MKENAPRPVDPHIRCDSRENAAVNFTIAHLPLPSHPVTAEAVGRFVNGWGSKTCKYATYKNPDNGEVTEYGTIICNSKESSTVVHTVNNSVTDILISCQNPGDALRQYDLTVGLINGHVDEILRAEETSGQEAA